MSTALWDRYVKGYCLSDLQIVVAGHPNTEKVTYQSHGHDCDYCSCIHNSYLLKVSIVRFVDAKLRLLWGICNQWL